MYPIEEFVRGRMEELGLTYKEMSRRAGYVNISKGIRRVQAYIPLGNGDGIITKKIHEVLEVDRELVRAKERETRKIRADEAEAERRASWYIHLHVLTERERPSSLTQCAMSGVYHYKTRRLPENFNQLEQDRQKVLMLKALSTSMAPWNGSIPLFGKIVGFVLVREYDVPYARCEAFDLEGNPMENPLNWNTNASPMVVTAGTVKGNVDLTDVLVK